MRNIESVKSLCTAILEKALRDYLRDVKLIFHKERELKQVETYLEGIIHDNLIDYDVEELKLRLQRIIESHQDHIKKDIKMASKKALCTNNREILSNSINSIRNYIKGYLKDRKKTLELQIHQAKKDQYIILSFIKSDSFEVLYEIDKTDLLKRVEQKENELKEKLISIWSEE